MFIKSGTNKFCLAQHFFHTNTPQIPKDRQDRYLSQPKRKASKLQKPKYSKMYLYILKIKST